MEAEQMRMEILEHPRIVSNRRFQVEPPFSIISFLALLC
jgi:hypothetical protein